MRVWAVWGRTRPCLRSFNERRIRFRYDLRYRFASSRYWSSAMMTYAGSLFLSTCTGPFFKALLMTESPLRLISFAGIVFCTVSFVVRMNLPYLNHPLTAISKNLSRKHFAREAASVDGGRGIGCRLLLLLLMIQGFKIHRVEHDGREPSPCHRIRYRLTNIGKENIRTSDP